MSFELTCSIALQLAHLMQTFAGMIDMTIPLATEALLRNWYVRLDFTTLKGNVYTLVNWCSWRVKVAVCMVVPLGVCLIRNLGIDVTGNRLIVNHSRNSSSEFLHRFSEEITPLIVFSMA